MMFLIAGLRPHSIRWEGSVQKIFRLTTQTVAPGGLSKCLRKKCCGFHNVSIVFIRRSLVSRSIIFTKQGLMSYEIVSYQ